MVSKLFLSSFLLCASVSLWLVRELSLNQTRHFAA